MPSLSHGRRIRHHVNPLKLALTRTHPDRLAPLPGDGDADTEIEVELGCADARFLFERARVRTDLRCVGIELRREMAREVNRRALEEGQPRVEAVFANINADLPDIFAPGQVARFFINFPDPWFKRGQHKRRLVNTALGVVLRDLLRPGGEIFFQSDVWDLALSAMAELEQVPGLTNLRGEWSFYPENPYGAQSLREVRVLARGLPVWRICYRKDA